jgi:heme exporter protein D
MHFDNWQAFWAMGGYGLFVWLSFGGSLLALLILWADSLLAKRSLFANVQREVARKQRIRIAQKAQKAAHQSASQHSKEIEVEKVNES